MRLKTVVLLYVFVEDRPDHMRLNKLIVLYLLSLEVLEHWPGHVRLKTLFVLCLGTFLAEDAQSTCRIESNYLIASGIPLGRVRYYHLLLVPTYIYVRVKTEKAARAQKQVSDGVMFVFLYFEVG